MHSGWHYMFQDINMQEESFNLQLGCICLSILVLLTVKICSLKAFGTICFQGHFRLQSYTISSQKLSDHFCLDGVGAVMHAGPQWFWTSYLIKHLRRLVVKSWGSSEFWYLPYRFSMLLGYSFFTPVIWNVLCSLALLWETSCIMALVLHWHSSLKITGHFASIFVPSLFF